MNLKVPGAILPLDFAILSTTPLRKTRVNVCTTIYNFITYVFLINMLSGGLVKKIAYTIVRSLNFL